jgi:hypothetical protein
MYEVLHATDQLVTQKCTVFELFENKSVCRICGVVSALGSELCEQ